MILTVVLLVMGLLVQELLAPSQPLSPLTTTAAGKRRSDKCWQSSTDTQTYSHTNRRAHTYTQNPYVDNYTLP